MQIPLSEADLKQIKAHGIAPEKVIAQLRLLKKGIPYVKLHHPCTVGDGIIRISRANPKRWISIYSETAAAGRVMKFVPASGAATRMFKPLIASYNRHSSFPNSQLTSDNYNNDRDFQEYMQFLRELPKFAFYKDLISVLKKEQLPIDTLPAGDGHRVLLEYLLTTRGLNYANTPKALIKFHRYREGSRTPLEEHLVEAAAYVKDRSGIARIHFTVSPKHREGITKYIEAVRSYYEKGNTRFEISCSIQDPATDSIAVDLQNHPLRDENDRLIFRPAGHGALLENLNRLQGDIIFIKNIDNVVPDRLKDTTILYKKVLGGFLINLQRQIFHYLERLTRGKATKSLLGEIEEFVESWFYLKMPDEVFRGTLNEKRRYLYNKLNRPLRVCGMVERKVEAGGGPFWVRQSDNRISLQIIESVQVDMQSPQQRQIWESATHVSPTDLVCAVRDYKGKPFNLQRYSDPETKIISIKTLSGRESKALELPGLWNGGMAYWNTVFVEVPSITFNPVKTVLALLQDAHQNQIL